MEATPLHSCAPWLCSLLQVYWYLKCLNLKLFKPRLFELLYYYYPFYQTTNQKPLSLSQFCHKTLYFCTRFWNPDRIHLFCPIAQFLYCWCCSCLHHRQPYNLSPEIFADKTVRHANVSSRCSAALPISLIIISCESFLQLLFRFRLTSFRYRSIRINVVEISLTSIQIYKFRIV